MPSLLVETFVTDCRQHEIIIKAVSEMFHTLSTPMTRGKNQFIKAISRFLYFKVS